ncbi:hypothetical protein BH24CHL3_BH24CHL3_00950 [soil metagenome]
MGDRGAFDFGSERRRPQTSILPHIVTKSNTLISPEP